MEEKTLTDLGKEYLAVCTDEQEADDELAHYGVIGMRWGVRKGRTAEDYRAEYKKASKKLKKLDADYERAERKAINRQAKLDRKINSIFASTKAKRKAAMKLNDVRRDTFKAANKGSKWVKRMEKNFAKANVSLSKEDAKLGEKYLEALKLRALR